MTLPHIRSLIFNTHASCEITFHCMEVFFYVYQNDVVKLSSFLFISKAKKSEIGEFATKIICGHIDGSFVAYLIRK